MCVPVIAPDGSIKLGESALCPPVASIYDTEDVIIDKIKHFHCRQCKIAWQKLKENIPIDVSKYNDEVIDPELSTYITNYMIGNDIRKKVVINIKSKFELTEIEKEKK